MQLERPNCKTEIASKKGNPNFANIIYVSRRKLYAIKHKQIQLKMQSQKILSKLLELVFKNNQHTYNKIKRNYIENKQVIAT